MNPVVRCLSQIAAYILLYGLLFKNAARLPGPWMVFSLTAVPVLLIFALRRWSGESWSAKEVGLVSSAKGGWAEAWWLLFFHTTWLQGILLLLAKFRYYDLLTFLVNSNEILNGFQSPYDEYTPALFFFLLLHFAWGGELLLRACIQGPGAARFSPENGAFTAWLSFGAFFGAEALRLGFPNLAGAGIAGLLALIPGPLFESYFLRYATIFPLFLVRAAAAFAALASAAFFLYWYPDRSFSVAVPVFLTSLGSLVFTSVLSAKKTYALLGTAARILRHAGRRGLVMGTGTILILTADVVVESTAIKAGLCLILLAYLRVTFDGIKGHHRDSETPEISQ